MPDVAGACERAVAAGGSVLNTPMTTATGLTFADILDPAGNHIGIFAPPAEFPSTAGTGPRRLAARAGCCGGAGYG